MLKKDLETFRLYRPFFIFLFKFFAVYAVLTVIYQTYLNQFSEAIFEVDSFTRSVAHQSEWLAGLLGYDACIQLHPLEPSVMFFMDGQYLSRVVEGCNAISVMILFTAFVVAFKGELKKTLTFLLAGIALIHVLNIVRIALLNIALLHYPEYGNLLHGVLFPAVIYGVVFVLWVVWVNKFSKHAARKD